MLVPVMFLTEVVGDTTATSGVALAAIGLCTLLIKVIQINTTNDRNDRAEERQVRKEEALAMHKLVEALNSQSTAIKELRQFVERRELDKTG